MTQDDLGLSGDDYDDSSKAAFEKFVADIKVLLTIIKIALNSRLALIITAIVVTLSLISSSQPLGLVPELPKWTRSSSFKSVLMELPSRRRWFTLLQLLPLRLLLEREKFFSSRFCLIMLLSYWYFLDF